MLPTNPMTESYFPLTIINPYPFQLGLNCVDIKTLKGCKHAEIIVILLYVTLPYKSLTVPLTIFSDMSLLSHLTNTKVLPMEKKTDAVSS